MIYPQPVYLSPLDFWKTNLNQLQLQQLASNNIAANPSPDSAGGGGEGGGFNNRPLDGSMAAVTGGGGGGEGEDHGWGTLLPLSMSEMAQMVPQPQPRPELSCPRCESTNTKFCYFNNYSLSEPATSAAPAAATGRAAARSATARFPSVRGGYSRHAKPSIAPSRRPPPGRDMHRNIRMTKLKS